MQKHVSHRRVEWADTDMAGIVHFSRFFVFMETAEHELRRALGFALEDAPELGWPRVSASCDYRRPLRFGDEVEIVARVVERGSSALTFGFTFRRVVGKRPEAEVAAEGRMTSVCCRLEPELRPVAIPQGMAAAVGDPEE